MLLTPERLKKQLDETVHYLKQHLQKRTPDALIVLGSGLGNLANHKELVIETELDYSMIPNFPTATVAGHAGKLIVATHTPSGKTLLLQQGRFHLYEGYSLAEVVFPVRVAKSLGVKQVTLTNAAGSLNAAMPEGSVMLITDQLNLTGQNPLVGQNPEFLGPRFFDMGKAFCPELQQKARRIARKEGIALFEGVYAGLSGPSYETPAEVRMLKTLGADAVGMSTVCEVLAARHAGLSVQAFSVISNLAAGLANEALSHEDVTAVTNNKKLAKRLAYLVLGSLMPESLKK